MVEIEKIKDKLKDELDKLKARFNTGHNLTLIYLPGENRINSNGIKLFGEIQGDHIIIYDDKAPLGTLTHEFVEYMLNNITQDYLLIINNQNKVIERLLYRQREGLVDKLINGFDKK